MSEPDRKGSPGMCDEGDQKERHGLISFGLVLKGCAIPATLCFLGLQLGLYWKASWPVLIALGSGTAIFSGLSGIGLVILLAKVIFDRLENDEDEYYSKNVER